ncbi:zinc finger CCHC-type and RNA-binding motif-containing protein 1-like isoform X2 [Amphiura filiformis]|uniref:zinc finger CCHC-type and RNA-binding motif-containing protein 1-like isoform X2 n=1 Tax=Amphiura filiformis TaxID=82378 RepID=UPI003B2172D2
MILHVDQHRFQDLRIFEKYGQVAKVTVLKDKETRKSKGVAFVLFLKRDDAHKSVRGLNNRELFGRKWKCSIATDNGRTTEFIKKKTYPDKTRCYECGEFGHLSYNCPQNSLGDREQPEKKEKKKKDFEEKDEKQKPKKRPWEEEEEEESESDEGEDPALETLSAAINFERAKLEEEEYRERVITGNYDGETSTRASWKRPKVKQSAYFSDEEELSDEGR